MTREEAAEQLKSIIEVSKKNERNEKEIDGYDEEALEMAIDALIDIEQINEIISAPFQESALKYQMIRDIVGGKDNTITTGQHCKDCECGKPDLSTWGTSRIPNHYTVYYGSSNTWSIKDVADTFAKHGLIAEQEPCEDAISLTKEAYSDLCLRASKADDLQRALDMEKGAYNALVKNIQCEDAISRQAVLDAIDAAVWAFCDYLIRNGRNDEQKPISLFADKLREYVREELPPVNLQRTGHWIATEEIEGLGNCKCSVCDHYYYTSGKMLWNYCPSCGARMVEPQERSDEE